MARPPKQDPLVSRSFRLEESTWSALGSNTTSRYRMLQELARAYARLKPGAKTMRVPEKMPDITPPPAEPSAG